LNHLNFGFFHWIPLIDHGHICFGSNKDFYFKPKFTVDMNNSRYPVSMEAGSNLNKLDETSKVALIFGVTGQDGSYLAELLIEKGYVVHGVRRRSSSFNTGRIDHLINDVSLWEAKFFLHYGDLEDTSSISRVIALTEPDEIYNLAAQSHVGLSFEEPLYTVQVDGVGSLRILETIRQYQQKKQIKFYQASTSELFGGHGNLAFDEKSRLTPQSPYAAAKLLAYWNTYIYREAYKIFAVNGILFNHESPRRGETFVTRKITRGLCRIKAGLQQELVLGNLYAIRDWGHAKDYVEAMWLMLQMDSPQDLVISTGNHYSVKDFIEMATDELDITLEWRGEGISEVGIDSKTGNILIRVDEGYMRPLEVDFLEGNSAKAQDILKWQPKTSMKELVAEMVAFDLELCRKESIFPLTHRI
jgi:GDPmannose 4,6-dehydratase